MSRNRNRNIIQPQQKVTSMTEQTTQSDVQEAAADTQEQAVEQQAAQPQAQESEKVAADIKQTQPSKQQSRPEIGAVTKVSKFEPDFKVQLNLDAYTEAMNPKKSIVPEEGGRWQYSLFTVIKGVLNAVDQPTFTKEWGTLLNHFNVNKTDLFNEKFMFRFAEHWPGSASEYASNRRLVFLLIQTSSPKTRREEVLKINLELVTEHLTEAQKVKLLNFYGG